MSQRALLCKSSRIEKQLLSLVEDSPTSYMLMAMISDAFTKMFSRIDNHFWQAVLKMSTFNRT